jgi:hypothetical protein
MANEATVFSLTTTELAAGNVSSEAGGKAVDVATEDAATMTASVDIGLYILKSKYESGVAGRSKLLQHLEKIRAKILESDWPAI